MAIFSLLSSPWEKYRATLKAKKAAYEQECYSYEKSVLTAFKEARNAIVDFNKIKDIYESRLQLERSSKATMELAQLQYINGVIGYLDVLDAQRSYFDAQIGLSNAIRDKQITLVKLYKALGGWMVTIPLLILIFPFYPEKSNLRYMPDKTYCSLPV